MQYFENKNKKEREKIFLYFSINLFTSFPNKFDFSFFLDLPRLSKILVNIEDIIIIRVFSNSSWAGLLKKSIILFISDLRPE